jgi:G:T-mismatch repair DNA endonuclease (very short patch repair protein)
MIFTIDQLNRFKQYAHRAMVGIEEWKNNRDVQVGRIAEVIQGAFSEGYHTAMHEVCSTPWEYACQGILDDVGRMERHMDSLATDGWELQFVSSGMTFWRRRKAVAEIAAKKEENQA